MTINSFIYPTFGKLAQLHTRIKYSELKKTVTSLLLQRRDTKSQNRLAIRMMCNLLPYH